MAARRSSVLRRRTGLAAVAVALSCGLAAGHGVTEVEVAAAGDRGRHGGPAVAFQRLSTFPVYRNSVDPTRETVAEITAVSRNGKLLISTDSPGERVTFTDITDPSAPAPAGALAVGGEPTSVAVHRGWALIAVSTGDSFTAPRGELLVVDLADRRLVRRIDLGGQPDSVAVSPSGARGGTFAAIAIENERDEDVADGALPQLPGGFLVTLRLEGAPSRWSPTRVDLTPAVRGVAGITAPEDLEPEYVSIDHRNRVAVTLQENNGVAVVDLRRGRVVNAFSAGTVDLNGVDTVEDGTIDLSGSLTGVPREPDGVAWVGDGLLATANEGDLVGGSRGWSVFDARTGRVVWDAGSSFDRLAARVGLYPESRSENKGSEPDNIAVASFRGRPHAFVGAERGNFVAVYDLADPRHPRFVQVLPVTNGPEGLLAIPSRNLFVASSEVDEPGSTVRSAITVFGLGRGPAAFPQIVSADRDGQPIGWGALSALAADQGRPGRLWSVSDSYYTPTRLFAVDASRRGRRPAVITRTLTVTEGGRPVAVDAEGLTSRPAGGFWLAAEGATGAENELLLLDDRAAVRRRVPLPAEVAAGLAGRGLEGVAVTGRGRSEQVVVALQSPLAGDPAGVARIGRYQVATGTWTWFGYPLSAGSNVGLSEVVALGGDRYALLERDNLSGPTAALKQITTVDLGRATAAGPLPLLTKRVARDLLPDLRATNGWVQEKVEGLAASGGRVYVVTDNDGVEDATGETVFLDLGRSRTVFGSR